MDKGPHFMSYPCHTVYITHTILWGIFLYISIHHLICLTTFRFPLPFFIYIQIRNHDAHAHDRLTQAKGKKKRTPHKIPEKKKSH